MTNLNAIASFVDLLRARAREHPARQAYTFLGDGGAERVLDYAEIERQARAVAAALQARGLAGERALLLYPPGLEFITGFLGCLFAGVVAVPAYPPDPGRLNRTLPRLQGVVADAEARAVLTIDAIHQAAEAMIFPHAPDLKALVWLATDALAAGGGETDWRDPGVGRDTLAFLQYTSGSTAAPRGVMLTHGNLLANSALIAQAFDHDASVRERDARGEDSRGVIWTPFYHDLGLIGGVLQPLYLGRESVFLSPLAFLHRPIRWLEAITTYRAITSGGPNFAYDLCVDRTTPAERERLDLRTWRVAFNGAEPIRRATLARFADTFAPYGFRAEAFYPCYGLAESTLIVTGGAAGAAPVSLAVDPRALEAHVVAPPRDGEARVLVSSGRALSGYTVHVVDPETRRPLPPSTVGELWVAGASVGRGYWNRTDETARTFAAYLATGEGPFLRTGDLGFCDASGELFVTGRAKDLIIIRGRNHYPQDLELTAEQSHPALRRGCGAAFTIDTNGGERLVVAYELDRQADADPAVVMHAIREAVRLAHEVLVDAVVLLEQRSIPKTSSGKIQRHACRAEYRAGTLAVVARWPDRAARPSDRIAG